MSNFVKGLRNRQYALKVIPPEHSTRLIQISVVEENEKFDVSFAKKGIFKFYY